MVLETRIGQSEDKARTKGGQRVCKRLGVARIDSGVARDVEVGVGLGKATFLKSAEEESVYIILFFGGCCYKLIYSGCIPEQIK